MHDSDLANYKMVANWLYRHIKLHEMDFSIIDANIEDIGLSGRAYNVLKENDIKSLQELLILVSNGHSIRVLKGAGKTVTKEIEEKVLKFQHAHIFKDRNVNMQARP
ncbi:hypothetical protein A4D02_09305 [Niastella koreensis]|nr:hypothetical protein A4D02_09305 [Niastella koreensis]